MDSTKSADIPLKNRNGPYIILFASRDQIPSFSPVYFRENKLKTSLSYQTDNRCSKS